MVDYLSINGARLAYRLAGPEDAPFIITLHGGRGFGKCTPLPLCWAFSREILILYVLIGDHKSDFKAYLPLSSKYRVFSFDYRGHGQSSRTEPYTFRQIVDDIEGVREHFLGGNNQCIIIGGSFGGFLAQQYAIAYPSHVSHLVLRGTAPSYHRT